MRSVRFGMAGRVRALVVFAVLLLVGLSGCKTQDDAAEAARQMVITAQAMEDYYMVLDRVLVLTQDTSQAQAVLLPGVPPMDPAKIKGLRKQIQLRYELAEEIAALSVAMQKVTGSTAGADSAAAADKFNTELVTLNAIGSSSGEATAVKLSVKLLVQYVQAQDEVKAARQVEFVARDLAAFFKSEEPSYEQINDGYLAMATTVTEELVKRNEAGTDAVFGSAVRPFGLTPALDAATTTTMQPYVLAKVDATSQAKMESGHRATEALGKALTEMSERVSLVAHEKPMKLKFEPVTLETVKKWIAEATKEAQ